MLKSLKEKSDGDKSDSLNTSVGRKVSLRTVSVRSTRGLLETEGGQVPFPCPKYLLEARGKNEIDKKNLRKCENCGEKEKNVYYNGAAGAGNFEK